MDERYMIAPQYKRPGQSKSIDFTMIFIVSHNEHPVFFVEVKLGLGTSWLETSLGGRLELSCMRTPAPTPVFERPERFPGSSQLIS